MTMMPATARMPTLRSARRRPRERSTCPSSRSSPTAASRARRGACRRRRIALTQLRFQRPDPFLQPAHQRQVVADAAQQGHRRVRVHIDESRRQRMRRQAHPLAPASSAARRVARQHRRDAAVDDGDRVVLEHRATRLDGDDPARLEQQVDGVHGMAVEARCGRGSKHIARRLAARRASTCRAKPPVCRPGSVRCAAHW